MHLVERVASGIPRMQEAMREANLPEPKFHTEGMFTAVFKRQITNSANYDTVNDTELTVSYVGTPVPKRETGVSA